MPADLTEKMKAAAEEFNAKTRAYMDVIHAPRPPAWDPPVAVTTGQEETPQWDGALMNGQVAGADANRETQSVSSVPGGFAVEFSRCAVPTVVAGWLDDDSKAALALLGLASVPLCRPAISTLVAAAGDMQRAVRGASKNVAPPPFVKPSSDLWAYPIEVGMSKTMMQIYKAVRISHVVARTPECVALLPRGAVPRHETDVAEGRFASECVVPNTYVDLYLALSELDGDDEGSVRARELLRGADATVRAPGNTPRRVVFPPTLTGAECGVAMRMFAGWFGVSYVTEDGGATWRATVA